MTRTFGKPDGGAQAVRDALRQDVRRILANSKLNPTQKEDKVITLLREALEKEGQFYRTDEGTALYFRNRDRKLLAISTRADSPFGQLVSAFTDLSVKRGVMANCLERLHAHVAEEAETVQPHFWAYNSLDADVIAINDFGGGMWVRRRGDTWTIKPNGDQGILFWTPSEQLEPWTPEFSTDPSVRDEDLFEWFLTHPHFADDVMTAQDQRLIYRALLLAPFFPSQNRTRPVLAHLGSKHQQQHDTGKTLWGKQIGAVLMGRRFLPTPVDSSEKGKEALYLSLMHQPFVLLDNVDTEIPWLNDLLCVYATGGRLPRRKLYSDATLVHIEAHARLCLTSRKAHFNRHDTASRTIPFRFQPITDAERKEEGALLEPILARRGQIWAGILAMVAQVQDALPTLHPPTPSLRLADFDTFGWCVAGVTQDQQSWQRATARLKHAQAGFALQDEPLVAIFQEILQMGDLSECKTSDLFAQITRTASQLGFAGRVPRNASAFTNHINQCQGMLEAVLDVQITTRVLHGYTFIAITRGTSWQTHGVGGVTATTGSLTEGGEYER
ncbi:MAG: hypothetical protein IIA00_09045 [Proteobacteria bacterium]|nr:hypothetical protein [Pseudomonadota bacterium]